MTLNSSAEKTEMIYVTANNIMLITLRDSVAQLIKRPHLSLLQVTQTAHLAAYRQGIILYARLIGSKLCFHQFLLLLSPSVVCYCF